MSCFMPKSSCNSFMNNIKDTKKATNKPTKVLNGCLGIEIRDVRYTKGHELPLYEEK